MAKIMNLDGTQQLDLDRGTVEQAYDRWAPIYDLVFGEPVGDDPVRELWMEGPDIQPVRRFIEEALARTDWAELILAAGGLLAAGVVASLLATRIRVPALVLFLGVGLAIGTDGLGWINSTTTPSPGSSGASRCC